MRCCGLQGYKKILILSQARGEEIQNPAMAAVITGYLTSVLLPVRPRWSSRSCLSKYKRSAISLKHGFAARIHASSTAFVEAEPYGADTIVVEEDKSPSKGLLACPICYGPLMWSGHPILSVKSTAGSCLECKTCQKSYLGNETHLELTAASGSNESMPLATEIFRTRLVSFLYERGWRQGFLLGGFPGPEKEFEMTKGYLEPVLGGNIIDASCGSGLFSRLFTKSGLFSLVVALDYSENMLKQCYNFIEQEQDFPKEKLILVRADISRLPFVSSSVDAVHAGAALHCWPSPSTAVAEISRVLRPGGVFVATTFILDGVFGVSSPLDISSLLKPFRQNRMGVLGSYVFLSERELEDLCRSCGLVDFSCVRNRQFVMISARKPT